MHSGTPIASSFPLGAIAERMEPILEVSKLRVILDGSEIFRDVSFELREGETLVVLGPNGSGKTVLLRALLGLLRHEGTIRWRPGLRLGYVPQRVPLNHDLPLTVSDFFELKRVPRQSIQEILRQVGLEEPDFPGRQLGLLSSGQFQRVLIAWALISHPAALLFDEPTAGIDIGGEETIRGLLRRMRERTKLSIILVTHELSAVYGEADHVLCMSHRKVAYGVPREILAPETLRDLYGRDVKLFRHLHHD